MLIQFQQHSFFIIYFVLPKLNILSEEVNINCITKLEHKGSTGNRPVTQSSPSIVFPFQDSSSDGEIQDELQFEMMVTFPLEGALLFCKTDDINQIFYFSPLENNLKHSDTGNSAKPHLFHSLCICIFQLEFQLET